MIQAPLTGHLTESLDFGCTDKKLILLSSFIIGWGCSPCPRSYSNWWGSAVTHCFLFLLPCLDKIANYHQTRHNVLSAKPGLWCKLGFHVVPWSPIGLSTVCTCLLRDWLPCKCIPTIHITPVLFFLPGMFWLESPPSMPFLSKLHCWSLLHSSNGTDHPIKSTVFLKKNFSWVSSTVVTWIAKREALFNTKPAQDLWDPHV